MVRLVPAITFIVLSVVANVGPAQFAIPYVDPGFVQAVQHETDAVAVEEAPEENDEQNRRRDGNHTDAFASSSGGLIAGSVRCEWQQNLLEYAPTARIFKLAPNRGPPRG